MTRYGLIGPTYPYRGGIAHYTTLLAEQLRQQDPTLLISFSRQYPRFLFPGRSDQDPSQRPLSTPAEYLLDPLNPYRWWQTVQRLQQWQADVVIIPWWVPFWAPAWAYIGRQLKQSPHPPRLLFICHNVLPHEPSRLDKLAIRTALARGDGFLVHARADQERLQTLFPDAPIRVTPLPTYQSLGNGAIPPAQLPAKPYLLFFGFVRPYKGLDILIDALPAVLDRQDLAQSDLRLIIAGEFWQSRAVYDEQIAAAGLTDRVTIIDQYLPDEELIGYVRQAELVVLPYRSATQSAVIQVAFGQGKPVITTDVGGLAEAVDHGRTGLVVPPEDPAALAAAINQYFDEQLAAPFAANISQEQERFSWANLADAIKSFEPVT